MQASSSSRSETPLSCWGRLSRAQAEGHQPTAATSGHPDRSLQTVEKELPPAQGVFLQFLSKWAREEFYTVTGLVSTPVEEV